MPKKHTINFCHEEAKKRNFVCLENCYINNATKMKWKCLQCNETWQATLGNVLSGTGCPRCSIEKKKHTCIKRYGKSTNLNLEETRKKTINSRKIPIETIKKRLYCLYGNKVLIDESSYVNTQKKCRFIDAEYGEWWATPNKVIDAKREHPKKSRIKASNTMFKRYGVTHNMRHPSLRRKNILYQKNCFVLKHWFSNEEIFCQGSYEEKAVKFFNKYKIDYNWQVQTFLIPNGKTYTPDCYLPEQDLWVEIKGYFWGDAKEKWDWFHKEHSNSELWNKEKLKEMKIL